MNCKPGDLAIVVADIDGTTRPHIGKIVRCIRPALWRGRHIGWFIEPRLSGHSCINDKCLRPIRDPGDDARDETLEWLPAPRETEAA